MKTLIIAFFFAATTILNAASPTLSGTNSFTGINLLTNAANQFAGSGSGLTNLPAAQLTGLIPASALPVSIFTNFFTQNTRFVDAGNGNDTNNGTVTSPWATIGRAQTSTPAGWTIAVNPGVYAGVATNGAVNYNLAGGASVNFSLANCTNSIGGYGNVTFTNQAAQALLNAVVTVNSYSTVIAFSAGINGNTFLTNSSYYFGILTPPNSTNSGIIVPIVSTSHLCVLVGDPYPDGSMCAYDITSHLLTLSSTFNMASNSCLKADIATVSGGLFSQGMGYWNCAVTYGSFNFNSSTNFRVTFLNNPYFSVAPSGISYISGAYQVQ